MQAQPPSTRGQSSKPYNIIGLLVLLATAAVVAFLLLNNGSKIAGTWVKTEGDAIACCGDTIAVLPLGKSLEFRKDGTVIIISGVHKYHWQDQTHLVIEYPFQPTVYETTLSSDGNTMHLGEQFTGDTHFTYTLVRR